MWHEEREREKEQTCRLIHRRDSQSRQSLKAVAYEWFKAHPHAAKRQKLKDLNTYLNGLGYHTTQGCLRQLSHHFKVDSENALRRLESLTPEQRLELRNVDQVLEQSSVNSLTQIKALTMDEVFAGIEGKVDRTWFSSFLFLDVTTRE
jgi:hypothetical protein